MEDKIKPTLDIFGNFLSKLSENSDHVYWLSSPDFKKIQYISPAYEKIWGRSRAELYSNPETWITFLHPEDSKRQHPVKEMAEKIASIGDAARFSAQYRIVRPDGEVRWIMDKGFPVYDNRGQCCGVTGVAVDITSEKKHELELKKAKEDAEAANRAKIVFIENMSHDIRTPLSGVIGMSSLLAQKLNDPHHKQYAQWINDSGEQLLKLLNGILEVISADNINENDINKEFFDLRQCIKDIVELETATAYLKGLDLRFYVDKDIPKFVYSDRIKVHRILLNLLGNAIKFTEKGHVALSAHLRELHKQHAIVQFSVTDTGIGILEEQQNKVFERFHKVTPSYKGIYSGFGVGLHIVLTYVKLLGGTIQLTSKLGVGTTFDFFLPFKCLNEDRWKEDHPSNNENFYVLTEPCRVLIVEDNTIALKVAEAVAISVGCQVYSATDGEEAFALIQTNIFDLIITDIGLPGISGYELTQKIREWEKTNHKPNVPIVGLTAHAKSHAEKNCLDAGMNDVFSKPITTELMAAILRKNVINKLSLLNEKKQAYGLLGLDLPDTEEELFDLHKLSLLDINKAINTVGNEGLVRQVLELMISEEIQKDIRFIKTAHSAGCWDEIEKFAHKMKGGAVYIGTVRMQYACQYLERYHKAGHTRLLELLYQQLITVVDDTQNHIREWLSA
ncbi:PAS domain-containing hybrid sensor histidine kinase/response regulator [Legionella sp. km772]|uniref:PAS domain-containing hybrid sensor histidine kinase/response regulator n=1 Tax=Legionella sp. km772 TaxID=2498111 RepID=UPI0013152D3A|nr:PAS domain-containing hybrid sensor histidine kinase/response regulator [Legionella sp. km772]